MLESGLTPKKLVKSDGSNAIEISAADNIQANVPFIAKSYTATEIAALTAVTGMIVFDSTNGVFKGYDGAAWQTFDNA